MPERTLSSRRAFSGRLLALRVDEVELESGRQATREVVEHPGAVAILAWDGERLAAVRQWRQAAAAELLEIPAGTREPGESPLVTAQRELAEECGLSAARWEEGPAFYTAPGFSTELLTLFLATNLSRRRRRAARGRGARALVAHPGRRAGRRSTTGASATRSRWSASSGWRGASSGERS